MACPSVSTGNRFLVETLSYLDCQAQAIGSFGFQSMAQSGSPASLVLSGLLTLFIAIFAIRLLFGAGAAPGDAAGAVLMIGIVLTLGTSWPAYRTLIYDVALKGPAELAASITPTSLPSSSSGFAERLQGIDRGIAALTALGTGRQTGSLQLEEQSEGGFNAIALQDEKAFGWARALYLGSVIGSLAILRIGGGLLLALTPLIAGLLLFEMTRGLFSGWLRALALVAVGSLGVTVLLSVQSALLESWLLDAINRRNLGYAAPTAPTELLALTLSFAIACAGILFLLAKMVFQNDWAPRRLTARSGVPEERVPGNVPAIADGPVIMSSRTRALAISESVAALMRRDEIAGAPSRRTPQPLDRSAAGGHLHGGFSPPERLGEGYRRNMVRRTGTHVRRDERT